MDKPERCQRLQWNNLELGYLRDNADMPNELVSFALDRSIDGVWNRKRLMGVKPHGVKIIPDIK